MIEGVLHQHAIEGVDTKFSKTFDTWFFPVGDDIRSIVADRVDYLRTELLWGPEDPLFPSTLVKVKDQCFTPTGVKRKTWQSVGRIEKIVKNAFVSVGLPPTTPHLFRDTLVLLADRKCHTPEQMKAWSQNLGHESVLTTLKSYGSLLPARQAAVMRGIGEDGGEIPAGAMARLRRRFLEELETACADMRV